MALAAYFTDPPRRNVLLLASCQALASSGNTILIAVAALVGQILADDKSLATLPIAFQWTATMCMTIPAAQLMRRYGRRAGLSLGAVIYAAGGALGFVAILSASFSLFALSCILTGAAQSFIQYYRFAAADTAPEDFKSKAISLVLAGGVVAAIVGGELAKVSTELFMGYLYAGCYAVVVVLGLVALATLQGLRIPGLTAEQRASSGRPLHVIARQPVFLVAVLAAAIAYASMILVMTATPLAMTGHGCAQLLHRPPDPALRRDLHYRARRWVAGDQPHHQHRWNRLLQFLDRARGSGPRLEFHVRRRHGTADRGLYD